MYPIIESKCQKCGEFFLQVDVVDIKPRTHCDRCVLEVEEFKKFSNRVLDETRRR